MCSESPIATVVMSQTWPPIGDGEDRGTSCRVDVPRRRIRHRPNADAAAAGETRPSTSRSIRLASEKGCHQTRNALFDWRTRSCMQSSGSGQDFSPSSPGPRPLTYSPGPLDPHQCRLQIRPALVALFPKEMEWPVTHLLSLPGSTRGHSLHRCLRGMGMRRCMDTSLVPNAMVTRLAQHGHSCQGASGSSDGHRRVEQNLGGLDRPPPLRQHGGSRGSETEN